MSKYYDATVDEVVTELETDRYNGLGKAKVKAALKRDGKNIVYPIPKGFFREYLLHMLTDYTSVLLLISAFVCLLFRHDTTAVVVVAAIVLSYSLCALVFLRAQKVLENMGSFALPVVKVLRDGKLYMARSEQIVCGDIIFLCAGDVVPADVRLIESDRLIVDESVISCGANTVKDAAFTAASALDINGQKNMAFAGTVVLSGSAKAVVVSTAAQTVICKMRKNKPVVSHEKLRVLEKLRKTCSYVGVGMLSFVFVMTVLSLFFGSGLGLFENLLTFLSLAVASMSELYMAFGYIIVACGIFGALRQYKNVNAGALIKNSSKIDKISRISCILAPKDGCFLVDELSVGQIYYDDVLYGINDKSLPAGGARVLEYAVISTGIYGGRNLVSINSAQNNVFSTEENAIISCAQAHSLYNFNLDKEYPLLDHVGMDDNNPFDTTLVATSDGNRVVVRGDAVSLITRCTHRTKNGKKLLMGAEQTGDLLLAANRMSIGGYRVCAVATKETGLFDLNNVSRAQSRLNFEGFIVFEQTLLPEGAKSVRACLDAGIKVMMLTDTSSESDRYTARSLGIIKTDDEILTAKAFSEMDDGVFIADWQKYSMLEGFGTSDKRKVIHLLKTAGQDVAFLGSSVDDGLVLSDADVSYCQSVTLSAKADKGGVDTMDKNIPLLLKSPRDGSGRGCDALKIKSDVIVSAADRNGGGGFNAIVSSIRVAKSIYENLFHMLSYLVSTQIARLILVVVSVFADAFIFTPAQIVVSGLIIDFAAVLVFAFDKPRRGILTEKNSCESKLASPVKNMLPSACFAMGWALAISLCCALGILICGQYTGGVFISFTLSQIAALTQFRSDESIFTAKKGVNNVFLFALACVLAFLFLAVNVPAVGAQFGVGAMTPVMWVLCITPAVLLFTAFEIYKLVLRHKELKKQGLAHTVEFKAFKIKKKKSSADKTEEFLKNSFSAPEADIEYIEEQMPDTGNDIPEEKLRELVRLSVLCALCEWDPAERGDSGEGYEDLAESISRAVSADSGREIIATVLIASLSADGVAGLRFDDCMACAEKIIEYMSLQ